MRPSASRARSLVLLVPLLVAGPALAQVPHDTTFTGRLVDDLGNPLTGPVDLELRIFDADSAGVLLYDEQHLGVALDPTGGFSVPLGLGSNPSGPFDADLFGGVDRWLEVVVEGEVLLPRQVIAAVPWALVAERANEVVRAPEAPRFEDCGDGTLVDHETGLQWEKKSGTVGVPVVCEMVACPDPHDVNNLYEWSNTGTDPDGNLFTDFLVKLNDPLFGDAAAATDTTGCLAGHCDWRLPTIVELVGILVDQSSCPGPPCIEPGFAAVGGPIASSWWSASKVTGDPSKAWYGDYFNGLTNQAFRTSYGHVRAVRVGSCR